jgi:hypothetical protein
VHYLLYLALIACSSLAALALPQRAHADAQVSARNQLEIGKRRAQAGDEVVVALGLRADVMFGPARAGAFRIGPAIELRTADFHTAEAAAGAGLLIPIFDSYPIGLYGLIGAATRKHAPDGAVGIGTATWGFRGYNYKGWYAYGLNLFVSGRKHLGEEPLNEITAGVEIDMQFTTIIPGAAIYNLFHGGDPHEN